MSHPAPAASAGRDPAGAALAATRVALHTVAEHILSAGRHQATGRIGLTVVDGGFATPPFGEPERVLAVVGADLVLREGSEVRSVPLTTLRAAGEFAGVTPGAPASVYRPSTPCDADAPLTIEAQVARSLADWYGLVAAALRSFAPDSPQTLWPEHFDLAIRVGEVNYGGLGGDAAVEEPYVYVGPDRRPQADPFFDQPFGAARTWREVSTVPAAVEFFREGARRAGAS